MGEITQDNKWYMSVTYEEAKKIIDNNIQQMSRSFVAIGFYLKHIRDNRMYLEDGYKNIWDFAEDQYGIRRSTATRWMAMNDRFSQDGNSPVLADQYKNFGKSQLQEMLYLTDEQAAEVTEDMTVKEIRELRKPAEEEPQKPYEKHGCITGWSRYPEFCSCCGHGGAECCSQCDSDSCNSRCGWINDPYLPETEKTRLCDVAQPQEPDVVDGEYQECCDDAGEIPISASGTQRKDIDVLKEMLEKEKTDLEECIKVDKVEPLPPGMIQKKKLLVGALASMFYDLEEMEEQEEKSQPELPIFRNNDQRKEWLRNYKDWGLWYEDSHIGVKYYKYQFDNGAVLVAEVHHQPATRYIKEYDDSYLHLIGGPEPSKGANGIGKWQRHERYSRYPSSETELVEFLKEVQRK